MQFVPPSVPIPPAGWRLLHARQLAGTFQLDEMHSFERDHFHPLSLPVLIEKHGLSVVDSAVAPIPRSGRMSPRQKELQRELERREGRRLDRSSEAVRRCLRSPRGVLRGRLYLETDRKPSYRRLTRQLFGACAMHRTCDARARRDRANPLFPINHINAMHRYSLSRLRRRTWCVTRSRGALRHPMDVFMVWKNYCRGIMRRTRITPAQALGVLPRRLTEDEFWYWRQAWRTEPRLLWPPRLAPA